MQLKDLQFDNSYARLPESWFQQIRPTALVNARVASCNHRVAARLGLNTLDKSSDLISAFVSDNALPGLSPLAMKYAGHQFGVYNPALGDGRGVLLGEVITPSGERLDLHLKGAGKTAYSRFGDGRAVLRSTIREYLVSSAMTGLNIPTTQALCLFASDEMTQREGVEPCAQLVRVTPCHIRFGHFEHFYYLRQYDDLRQLADYCIERFYPEFVNSESPYLAFFNAVLARSAKLVALWQAYGFVHGVLNTDNMSILGEAFDYGPFTFMDSYQPGFVSNQNDFDGRYAFENQPEIVRWNLTALAQALTPLVPVADLEKSLMRFGPLYREAFYERMSRRLGVDAVAESSGVIDQFLKLAAACQLDINRFLHRFEQLALNDESETVELFTECAQQLIEPREINEWLGRYQIVKLNEAQRQECMQAVNPRFILRNYMAQEAIEAAHRDNFRLLNDLVELLETPFESHSKYARFAGPPPDWAGAICLTCSS